MLDVLLAVLSLFRPSVFLHWMEVNATDTTPRSYLQSNNKQMKKQASKQRKHVPPPPNINPTFRTHISRQQEVYHPLRDFLPWDEDSCCLHCPILQKTDPSNLLAEAGVHSLRLRIRDIAIR